jgi:hypothetical protein
LKFNKSFEETLNEIIEAKFISSDKNKFSIVGKSLHGDIRVYLMHKRDTKWELKMVCSSNKLFNNEKEELNINDDKLSNVCITSLSRYLLFYDKNELFMINSENLSTVAKSEVIDYKLIHGLNKIENNLKILHEIEGSDDLIALNDKNQFVYVKLEKDLLKVQEIELNKRFTTFRIQKKILVAFDEIENELNGFDLGQPQEEIFKTPLFSISVPDGNLQHFCISSNSQYLCTIQNMKILDMYQTKDAKRIAHLPLYSEANSMCISDDFVSLAMKDRKVLSYFIADPLKPEQKKRIKLFKSRNVKNLEKRKAKIKSLMNKANHMLAKNLPNEYEIFKKPDNEKEVDEEITEKLKLENQVKTNESDSDEEDYNERDDARFLKGLRKSNVLKNYMNFKF